MEFSSNEKAKIHRALANKPSDAKIIVAFSDIRTYENLSYLFEEILKQYPHTGLLSLNYFLSKWLQKKEIQHGCIYTKLLNEEHSQVMEQANHYTKTWFKDKKSGEDFTMHNGLSMGFCVELNTYNFFHSMFKCAADIRSYLKRETPDLILYLHSGSSKNQTKIFRKFNLFKHLLPVICYQNKFEFHEVSFTKSGPHPRDKWFETWLGKSSFMTFLGIKFRLPNFIYFIFKTIFLSLKNISAKMVCHPQKPNIFFAGPTTVNYLGSALIRKIIQSKRFNLMVWRGESKQTPIVNIIPYLTFEFLVKQIGKRKLRNAFKKKFQVDREKIKPSTQCEDIPIFELFSFYFEDLYCNHFPNLAIHAEQVKNWLVKNNIDAVVSHTEQAAFERATLLTGNSLSIPTIHFQHGLYIPKEQENVALYLFGWGKVNKDFKISKGIEEWRIKTVGRSMNGFSENGRETQPPGINQPGTMLLILNPVGQFRIDKFTFLDNEQTVKLSLAMIKAFPKKRLIIKPREDDLQINLYKDLLANSKIKNAEITTQPILPLLKNCDLFFHFESTVALEGLLLDKPGIQFRFPFHKKGFLKGNPLINFIPFVEYGANVGVDKPDLEMLIDVVKSIYQSVTLRKKLKEGSEKFLQDYANLGNGDASQNFIEALASLVSYDKKH